MTGPDTGGAAREALASFLSIRGFVESYGDLQAVSDFSPEVPRGEIVVSFDEVVLWLFMTGPRISTLPVAMYHHVEQQADPLVASLSVLLVVLTLLVVILVDRTAGLARTFVK